MLALTNKTSANPFYGEPLSADSLFGNLPLSLQKSLSKIRRQVYFPPSEAIFLNGENPCCIYVFIKGEARFYLNSPTRANQPLRKVYPNEILGLPESLSNFPCERRVETISACVCDSFWREDFISLLNRHSEIGFRLLQTLGGNLQKSYKNFSAFEI